MTSEKEYWYNRALKAEETLGLIRKELDKITIFAPNIPQLQAHACQAINELLEANGV